MPFDTASMVSPETAEIIENLTKACDLIDRKGWCQGAYAVSKTGRKVKPDGKAAARFCLMGAVMIAGLGKDAGRIENSQAAVLKTIQTLGFDSISLYNDAEQRSEGEVLALLDETITRLTLDG